VALVYSPIAGCSHFESHKHIDLKPFAEQMIEVAGNIQYGLAESQPIIDEVAYAAGELFEDTKLALDAAIHEIRSGIDADNAGVKEANRQLKQMQIATVLNVHYVREYRTGNRSALDTLLVREPTNGWRQV